MHSWIRFQTIVVTVSAGVAIKSVTAAVAGQQRSLFENSCAYRLSDGSCQKGWIGSVTLTGLSRGDRHVLTITAVDAANASATVEQPVTFDQKPTIAITAPQSESAVRPAAVRVAASCADDDRCVRLRLLDAAGTELAMGASSVDVVVSLASFDGARTALRFEAMDTAGQLSLSDHFVYVESSARLAEVFTSPAYESVVDLDADRFLLVVYSGPSSSDGRWFIRDRSTGKYTSIQTFSAPIQGVLTPGGAAMVNFSGMGGIGWEWRDGTLSSLGSTGGIALDDGWLKWFSTFTLQYRLRRVAGGAVIDLPYASYREVDAGSNGDLAYERCTPGCVLERDRGGVTTVVDPAGSRPTTDGVDVVYRVVDPQRADRFDIVRWREGTKEVLAAAVTGAPSLAKNLTYQMDGGWIAYLKPDANDRLQAWTRSPAGVHAQRSAPDGPTALLDKLAPTGEVAFTAGGRRLLSRIGAPPVDISMALGSVYLAGDRWYVRLGKTLFLVAARDNPDLDADGLPDAWERQFGLDPVVAGGNRDDDGDGATNLDEFQRGTHPRGYVTRYFAEGAASPFFDTQFALLNTSLLPATVLLRYLKDDGSPDSTLVTLPPQQRRTVRPKDQFGPASAAFSTIVESDEMVAVDRTMTWDGRGYGAHAETGLVAPATEWFLAEGATHSGFNLFYLIQNPGDLATHVTVTFLLPAPAAPLRKTYSVAPRSRFNIWVNDEARLLPALAATDVSARLESEHPIIVERAMYLDSGGLPFGAGHESAGVTAPALTWFLAEGATGPYFDEFVLVANPNPQDAEVTMRFLLSDGTVIAQNHTIPATSRRTFWVDTLDPRLADAAVSTTVTVFNGVPVVVERAMWWPGPTGATWTEAHNSPGVTQTGGSWALAEGEVGGVRSTQTYILVANTSATAASVAVTLYFEDGTRTSRTFPIPATSRFNVDVATEFPTAAGRRFGAIVSSFGSSPAQIVVERAMYWDAGGVRWAAGTNAVAVRLQ